VWPADARHAARVAAGTLLWLAVWFGIGAWLAVYFVGLIQGPRDLPAIPGAVPTQPNATAWASPKAASTPQISRTPASKPHDTPRETPGARPRGYWYRFPKLTGARAATLPVWSPTPVRDTDSW